MRVVNVSDTVKQPKSKAVRLWSDLEAGQALEFDNYEKMRSAYFAVRSYIKYQKLTSYTVKQHTIGHPPGYFLLKVKNDG